MPLLARALAALLWAWQARAGPVSTYEFLSRPDIIAPTFNILSINRSVIADGYIFVTPKGLNSNFTETAYIYNDGGSLVWSAHAFNIPDYRMTVFDVCEYRNAPHICLTMFKGSVFGFGAGSFSRILDHTFSQVQAVAPDFTYHDQPMYHDMHEFNPVGNGSTALVTSYADVPMDLTFEHCPGAPTVRHMKTGLFSEITTDGSNRTLFTWSAVDHVDPHDTPLCPGYETAFSGNDPGDSFDFFHINSVDKNEDGDYLISSRHTWTIYKIAGLDSPTGRAPGDIIWRLGGPHNNFTLESRLSKPLQFSYQHHARFIPGGIRFFDNANSEASETDRYGLNPTSPTSSGMEVQLDEDHMTATLVQQSIPPTGALDHSQGSYHGLPNGNHFCGLGSINEVFESSPDGTVALSASIGQKPVDSYRAMKRPWTATPPESEFALFAYAHNISTPNVYYVSWNGATQIQEYRVQASNSSDGPFATVATASKDYAFETKIRGPTFDQYSYVQAYAQDGQLLGRSKVVKTFVPADELVHQCTDQQCAPYTDYKVAPGRQCLTITSKYVHIC